GSKGDLAMVAGADTLLDKFAGGALRVTLDIDTQPFEGGDELEGLRPSSLGGGDYLLRSFNGTPTAHQLWLCDVTLFVFGNLPPRIYVRMVPGTMRPNPAGEP
ncbi:MAG: hypothetical protein JWP27_1225, partial [Flaviaesturariibacter sp.]|nr:hypothetical protein [Flaviaesturariibacter sp.]